MGWWNKLVRDRQDELSALVEQTDAHENEIRYLEEVLVATTGPSRDICDELERNKLRLQKLRDRVGVLHNEITELKQNED